MRPRCASRLVHESGCTTVPNYGVGGHPKMWCKTCAELEWVALGTPQDLKASSAAKCASLLIHQSGCST